MKEALYYRKEEKGLVRCELCPHRCRIPSGQRGRCLARRNREGILYAESYGQVTSLALDPMEKKPLRRFLPGSRVLSLGSYGCNMSCPFCQNHHIAARQAEGRLMTPEQLAEAARSCGSENAGAAFTYNEPLVGYEYVLDCARLLRAQGQKTVLVTNGMLSPEPLEALLPWTDALNIDLKCFREDGYRDLGGSLEAVRHTIAAASRVCHVEVTTLVVPGISDDPTELEELARWLASVDRDIPLHVSRYVPRHRMQDVPATAVSLVYHLAGLAKQHLKYVYTGNC